MPHIIVSPERKNYDSGASKVFSCDDVYSYVINNVLNLLCIVCVLFYSFPPSREDYFCVYQNHLREGGGERGGE